MKPDRQSIHLVLIDLATETDLLVHHRWRKIMIRFTNPQLLLEKKGGNNIQVYKSKSTFHSPFLVDNFLKLTC